MSGSRGTAEPALRIFLVSRVALWILAAGTVLLFESSLNPERIRWDSDRLHELGRPIDVWARWDSDWYLKIAREGYSWPSSTPAFFPLYPALVAGLGRLLAGHYLLAGVLLSLAAGAGAFVLVHRLAVARLGPEAATRAVVYLALFPTSLFLGAVYSEPLFLLLAVATFLLGERGRLLEAAIATGLAMLTRPAGAALLPALAWFAWRSRDRRRGLVALAIAGGLFSLYPLALWAWIGRPLAFLDAQEGIWRRELSPAGPFGGLWQAATEGAWHWLAFTLAFLGLCAVAWRRLGAAYGLYGLVVLALPLSFPAEDKPLLSVTRFALTAFPVFLVLAEAGRSRLVHTTLVAGFSTLLAVAVVKWALWEWVA